MLSIRCHARDDLVAFGNLIVEVMISGSRLLLANWLITVTLIEIWNQYRRCSAFGSDTFGDRGPCRRRPTRT